MQDGKYKYIKKPTTPSTSTHTTPTTTPATTSAASDKYDGDYAPPRHTTYTLPIADCADLYAPPVLLSDQQMAEFIRDGYLVLKTDLSPFFHQSLYKFAESLKISRNANPGNNILPSIPPLQFVFDSPSVRGALTSILGSNYMMHPHRHPHKNPPGFKGQQWHQDSYFGHRMTRHHFPSWVMAMYYPQKTTMAMGPTAIAPGSQYYAIDGQNKKRKLDELPKGWNINGKYLECDAGTVVLIHYDIWHKGTPNISNTNRYMFKFQFVRIEPPLQPSWNNTSPIFPFQSDVLSPLYIQIWNWLRGDTSPTTGVTLDEKQINALLNTLKTDDIENEPHRLAATYTLAHANEGTGVHTLLNLVSAADDNVRRCVSYGLGSAKSKEVASHLAATRELHRNVYLAVVVDMLGALAWIGRFSIENTVPTVLQELTNKNEIIRRYAAETLGHVMFWLQPSEISPAMAKAVVTQVSKALEDSDAQTRFSACLCVARMAKNEFCGAFVKSLEAIAWNDTDRYARAYALTALERIGTKQSFAAFSRVMWAHRICPITTDDSPF